MAVRRCVTAGVAIAAVGAIAAAPAIAPPLQPRDVQVVNDVNMRLAADVRDLINTFFGESPGDSGGPGTIGFPGVFHQLLLNANVNDPRGTQVINSFFQNGTSDVVRLLLTRDNLDPVTVAQINTFFNSGMSDLVRLRLLMFNADPTQRAWINKFFGGAENDDGSTNVSQNGIPGVVYKFISERGLSPDQLRALNTFFNRGELQLGEQGNPVLDEWGEPIYFGNSNPAYRGFPGLAYNGLTDSGLSPDQQQTLDDLYDGGVSQVVRTRLLASTTDPNQIRDIIALFGDPNDSDAPYGLSENVRWRLIAGANGDQRSIDLTNELFDNGISGVVRYLLVGPVPELPESALVADEAVTFAAAASVDEPVDTTPVDPAPADITPAADTEPVVQKKAPEPVEAAPAAQPVAVVNDPAPVPAPAPAPALAPAPAADPVSKEDDGGDAKEVTEEELKSGNKVEVDPILLQNGTGGAGTAWDQTVQRWKDFANRIGFGGGGGGGAPAPASPSAPDTGGETGGDGSGT